jgi:ubiquitin carboxyl-terminal hydrolase 7
VKLFIPRIATLDTVIRELVKKVPGITEEMSERIRLFEVRTSKDYKEFQPSQSLTSVSMDSSYGLTFFAEAVPLEEITMSEQDRFVMVIHFSKELSRLHSIPVKFVIKPVAPPNLHR